MSKITFKLSPFDALTIMTLCDNYRNALERIPSCSKILDSVNEFRDQALDQITAEHLEDATIEREIHTALHNIHFSDDDTETKKEG
jgi:hypothetical protein